jgi:hypothetical protein
MYGHSVTSTLIFIVGLVIYSVDQSARFACIIPISNYSQQDAKFFDLFIFTDAICVSGGSSAHHQENITVHTASGIVNQYCCWLVQWKRWNGVEEMKWISISSTVPASSSIV